MPTLRITAIFSIIVLCLTASVSSVDAALKKRGSRKLDKQLLKAAEKGDAETVLVLLAAGADANAEGSTNITPLFYAAFYNHPRIVTALLDHGADIDHLQGSVSALMAAAEGGNLEVVRILIERGAKHKEKALKVAQKGGHAKIAELLSTPDFLLRGMVLMKKPLPPVKGRPPAIAIPDMFSHQLSPGEVGVLSDKVRGFMTETGYFDVLSDPDMKSILKAQDFNVSDRCDDAMCLAEMGKILQVEKVIGGSVGQLGKRYSLSLRIVNVESGKIEHHVDRDLECPVEQLLDVVQLLAYELAKEYAEARTEQPPNQSMP